MSAQCPVCSKADMPGRFMSTCLTNLMTQHAQIAERKYCRTHARPFRLRFARVVAVFPVCSPATAIFPLVYAENPMITLYSYPELFGVADNNGYGLKVFAFLRLNGMPFKHEHVFDASAAP